MSDGLEIVSGPTATAVALDDLHAAAVRVVAVAGETAETGLVAATLASDVDLLVSVVRSPVTGLRVEAALWSAAGAAGVEAGLLAGLGSRIGLTVLAYAAAERQVELLVQGVQDLVSVLLLPAAEVVILATVAAEARGVPAVSGLETLAFHAPGTMELVAGGLVPVIPGLVATARRASYGMLLTEHGSVVVTRRAAREEAGPTDLAELVGSGTDLGTGRDAAVRVTLVHGPDGAPGWIVQVPGTQVWGPVAGSLPFDLTSDVLLLTQQDAAVAAGVTSALDDAVAAAQTAGEAGQPVHR